MRGGVEQSLDRERMLKTVLFAVIQRKRSKSHSGIPSVAVDKPRNIWRKTRGI
jgi:hypothetical protein